TAKDHDGAAGHVLATVVAAPLDDRDGARVPDAHPLADATCREQGSARSAVEQRVARDDVTLHGTVRQAVTKHQLTARHGLADVVLRLAGQGEVHAGEVERPEALPHRTGQLDPQRPVW